MISKILTFIILLFILYFINKHIQFTQQLEKINIEVAKLHKKINLVHTKNIQVQQLDKKKLLKHNLENQNKINKCLNISSKNNNSSKQCISKTKTSVEKKLNKSIIHENLSNKSKHDVICISKNCSSINVIESPEYDKLDSESETVFRVFNTSCVVDNDKYISTDEIKGRNQISLNIISNDDTNNTTIPIGFCDVINKLFEKNNSNSSLIKEIYEENDNNLKSFSIKQIDEENDNNLMDNLLNMVNKTSLQNNTKSINTDNPITIISNSEHNIDKSENIENHVCESENNIIYNDILEKFNSIVNDDNKTNSVKEILSPNNDSESLLDNKSETISMICKNNNIIKNTENNQENKKILTTISINKLLSNQEKNINKNLTTNSQVNTEKNDEIVETNIETTTDLIDSIDTVLKNKSIEKYTKDDLTKKSLNHLKSIAKKYKIQLTNEGKAKTKLTLISDILSL